MIEYKLDKNGNLFPIKVFSINSKCPKCNHSYRQEEQKGKPFFICISCSHSWSEGFTGGKYRIDKFKYFINKEGMIDEIK